MTFFTSFSEFLFEYRHTIVKIVLNAPFNFWINLMASLTTGRRWYSWLPLVGDPQPHRLNVILGSWLTRLVILGFIQWGYERVCSDVLRSLQF
jgi:hypothetical protein